LNNTAIYFVIGIDERVYLLIVAGIDFVTNIEMFRVFSNTNKGVKDADGWKHNGSKYFPDLPHKITFLFSFVYEDHLKKN